MAVEDVEFLEMRKCSFLVSCGYQIGEEDRSTSRMIGQGDADDQNGKL